MGIALGANSYGKDGIRLVKVVRGAERHEVYDVTVGVRLEGGFEAVHTAGDNAACLPTDTMRATTYAMAKDHPLDDIERFACALVERFLAASPAASRACVAITEHPWSRLEVGGRPHHHTFTGGGAEARTTLVAGTREGVAVESGIEGLLVLKTTGSAFTGFLTDRYTLLEETTDRILATSVTARWAYAAVTPPSEGYRACRARVRRVALDTFAEHDSQSLQHTLYAMGAAVLVGVPEIVHITFTLPNKHHIPADLAPFGLTNDGEVFVATDRPYGVIEATVERTPPSAPASP
jgi:urate oxidase